MKKISRKDLQGLRRQFPVLSKDAMKNYVGGYNGGYTGGGIGDDWLDHGFYFKDPDGNYHWYRGYTQEELDNWEGDWPGGWVAGWGYVAPDGFAYGTYQGWNNYDPWGNDYPSNNGYPGWSGNGYPGYFGFYGYYGYDENFNTGNTGNWGGGSAGGPGDSSSSSQSDGVNINDTRNFTFNTITHEAFNELLKDILESNSILKTLLSYFDKGYLHLTFGVEGMDKNIVAYTTFQSYDSYHIVFNTEYITENGWNISLSRIDNIGYDWHKVKTTDEALLVTLTHEAIHANHFAIFNDAFLQANMNKYDTYRILQEKGYSQEFIDIFIDKDTNEWVGDEQRDVNMHNYINKYDLGIIDSALDEYRKDFK